MTGTSDNPALEWAREQMWAIDRQRETAVPLYVSPDMPPDQALKTVRDFAGRLVGPNDKTAALIVVALDRILDQLAGYQARVVYEKAEKG